MTDKKAFLLLWKWAVKLFRMRWFHYKAVDNFLEKGVIPNDEHRYEGIKTLYMVRKCFETVKDGLTTQYWIKIELLISEPFKDIDLLTELKGKIE